MSRQSGRTRAPASGAEPCRRAGAQATQPPESESRDEVGLEADLPEGWQRLPLASMVEANAHIQYGILQPGPDTPGGVPYVRPSEIQNDEIAVGDLRRTTRAIADQYARSSLLPGDVLLSIVGSIGKVALVPPELAGANITQSSARLRPRAGVVDSRYLAWLLRSPHARRAFDAAELGTGVHRLNIGDLRQMLMPLAPLPEQKRIVEKIDALLAEVTAAREHLTRVRELLRRLRQSVLAAACSGRLTEEWRARHAAEALPADAVLAARRRAWIQAETIRRAREDRSVDETELAKRYAAPPGPDARGEAPESWLWTTLDQITLLSGGLTKGQKRSACARLRRVPYLRVANVQRGHLDLSVMKEIDATDPEIGELQLQAGDILLNEGGDIDKLGRGWVWEGQIATCIHQNHVFRARPLAEVVNPYFVSHYANAVGQDFFFSAGSQTVNLASISLSRVRTLPVPLPPLAEQAEIVHRVGALLARADAIENAVGTAAIHSERASRAILDRALRGKLGAT